MAKKQKRSNALALPMAAQRLVSSVSEAERTHDWTPVYNTLATHPELYEIMDGLKARALARAGIEDRSNVPAAGSQFTQKGHMPYEDYVGQWKEQPDMVPNVRIVRRYAEQPWVRTAIDLRRQQVSTAEIAVLPLDTERPYDKNIEAVLNRLIKFPNPKRQNWAEFIGSVIEDVLTLDRGTILKDNNAKGQPVYLYPWDGGTIRIYPDWSGDPKQPRYLYDAPEGGKKTPLLNDECIVIAERPSTVRFGLSRVQILLDTIARIADGEQSASESVGQRPPSGLIHLQGANDGAVRGFRSTYDTNIAGKRKVMFAGGEGDIKWLPFGFSMSDNQALDWIQFLVQEVAATFQVSVQALGFMMDANKSNSSSQQEREEDSGLIPLLLLLERYLNSEVVGPYAPTDKFGNPDFDKLNLGIVFPQVSEAARIRHALELSDFANAMLVGIPSMTVNEIREMRGQAPMDGGDMIWLSTKTGPIPFLPWSGRDQFMPETEEAGDLGEQDPSGGANDEDDPDETESANGHAEGKAPDLDSGMEANSNAAPPTGQEAANQAAAKAWVSKAADGANHGGVMVALYPDADTAAQLAIPDGEPASDLHITLTYHGDADQYTPEQLMLLRRTVARTVGSYAPLEGSVGGIIRFTPDENEDGKHPICASIDVPYLTKLREDIASALALADLPAVSNHGYTPHATLMYVNADDPTPIDSVPMLPLYFHNVHVVISDEHYVYEMGEYSFKSNTAKVATKQAIPVAQVSGSRRPGAAWRPNPVTTTKAAQGRKPRDKATVTAKARKALQQKAHEIFESAYKGK